jgi:hypothetical protein
MNDLQRRAKFQRSGPLSRVLTGYVPAALPAGRACGTRARGFVTLAGIFPISFLDGLTYDPELRAGSTRRAHRGTLAAATDKCLGGSEVQPA